MRGQRAIAELSSVEPAKHDGSSGKDRITVTQQELKSGSEDSNGHIDLLVRIFRVKVVFKEGSVGIGAEPGEIHRLAIDLKTVWGVGGQRADKFGFKSCQARQLEALVEKHNDVPCRGRHRQSAGGP